MLGLRFEFLSLFLKEFNIVDWGDNWHLMFGEMTRQNLKNPMNNITLFPTDDPDFISFEYGAPGPDLMPSQDLLNEAMKHRVSSSHSRYSTCQYGPSLGDIHFRQLLKEWLSMDTLPIVTSGASQSLSNIITLFTDSNTR